MYGVIIVAGGAGKRMGIEMNKVLIEIHGKLLIDYVIERFEYDTGCEEIVLVVREDDLPLMIDKYSERVSKIVVGGDTRTESVANGLKSITSDYVLVHDGARPYVNQSMLERLKLALRDGDSVSLAVPVVETVKRLNGEFFGDDVHREELVLMQTPQGFKTSILQEAYRKREATAYTCDVTLVKCVLGISSTMVLGDRRNIKLTTLDDLALLELILNV